MKLFIFFIITLTTITIAQQENLLFLIADDLNTLVNPYTNGPCVKTPFLNAQHNFTIFRSMHAAVPLCNPSRTATWYGLDSRVTNILNNQQAFFLPNSTLFATLTNAGYDVIAFGKLFHGNNLKTSLENSEFAIYPGASSDSYPGSWPIEYEASVNDTQLINTAKVYYYPYDFEMNEMYWYKYFIKGFLSGKIGHSKRPFALFIGIGKPHNPFYVPSIYVDTITKIPPPDQNISFISSIGQDMIHATQQIPGINLYANMNDYSLDHRRTYKALVTYVDSFVNKVYTSLVTGPFAENTHFIFTSDHGYSNGDKQWYAKMAPWRRVTQVPFYYWHNSNTDQRSRWDHHSLIDVYPSILELLNIPIPDGLSLSGTAFSFVTSTINSFAVTKTQVFGYITNGLYWSKYHWIEYIDTVNNITTVDIYNNTSSNIIETENIYNPSLSNLLKNKYLAFISKWTPF